MKPRALILLAPGTNRDLDVANALQLSGAQPEIVPLNNLRQGKRQLSEYQMLVIPGGFSYADALGAGKLLSLDLQAYFADQVQGFVSSGKPVIGICNGFQALVKAGILPGGEHVPATLTFNQRKHFECRWVTLAPISSSCIWTKNLTEPIYCPVAHGEGNFVTGSPQAYQSLCDQDLVALVYTRDGAQPANGGYPVNPNGSIGDIAGVCNSTGNVLGLMPHPENHIHPFQHPRWSRGESGSLGLSLFQNGVRYAQQN